MPIKILMPALSPTMTEGNLAKWMKKEGDEISPGEVIAEIETDKATMEVEAVDSGKLAKIILPAGSENVAVNSVIAILLEEGEELGDIDDAQQAATPPRHHSTEPQSAAPIKPADAAASQTLKQEHSSCARIFASPLARRLAQLNGVDLHHIQGTGPAGRIVKADVLASAGSAPPARGSQVVRSQVEQRLVPNSNIRKIIAKRLLESKQTVPHFYLSIECNMDKLLELRKDINDAFEASKLSVNDFIIKASALALKEVDAANASWSDAAIIYYNNVDISVAVAIEDGLITPIIKNADQKDVKLISQEMKELIKKAKENKLKPEEFQGGGFSISNLGMFGIKKFSAIINPPQSCILAVGESSLRPIVVGDQVKIATIMDVTISCDHRVVDGAVGAKFLATFKKFIEKPALMLL